MGSIGDQDNITRDLSAASNGSEDFLGEIADGYEETQGSPTLPTSTSAGAPTARNLSSGAAISHSSSSASTSARAPTARNLSSEAPKASKESKESKRSKSHREVDVRGLNTKCVGHLHIFKNEAKYFQIRSFQHVDYRRLKQPRVNGKRFISYTDRPVQPTNCKKLENSKIFQFIDDDFPDRREVYIRVVNCHESTEIHFFFYVKISTVSDIRVGICPMGSSGVKIEMIGGGTCNITNFMIDEAFMPEMLWVIINYLTEIYNVECEASDRIHTLKYVRRNDAAGNVMNKYFKYLKDNEIFRLSSSDYILFLYNYQ